MIVDEVRPLSPRPCPRCARLERIHVSTAKGRDRAIAAMVGMERLLDRFQRFLDRQVEALDARGEPVLGEPARAALRLASAELFAARLSLPEWRGVRL